MRRLRRMAMLLPLLAAACATNEVWQNPDVPQEQWSEDKTACRDFAERQAERDFALSQQSNRTLNYDRGGQWAGQMNRFSATQRQDQLFASCMTQRGYRLLPPPEPAE